VGLAGLSHFGLPGRILALLGSSVPQAPNGLPVFEVIPSSASGITFARTSARSPQFYLPETLGGGGGFIDYDNDGWMDIYLVNSGKCDLYDPSPPLRNALYHNNRDGTFTDVAEKAGLAGGGYGMAVAVGDYDGDGRRDLCLTQYGRRLLFHNNGDGTFTDVTEKSGIDAVGFAASAVWFDYNNDGLMDFFIANDMVASFLFANHGRGKFEEIGLQTGVGYSAEAGTH
jgi:hypothetical protein